MNRFSIHANPIKVGILLLKQKIEFGIGINNIQRFKDFEPLVHVSGFYNNKP